MKVIKEYLMADNVRSTRECALTEIDNSLSVAIQAHLSEYKMTIAETSIQMCCETESTQKKKGVFGGSEKAIQAVILTDEWVIWGDKISGKASSAGSARIDQIEMRDYERTTMFNIIPDSGVNITGQYSDSSQTGQLFIALDTGPAGTKFRELLREAIKNSKK
jgi:hypothetical protein